MIKCTKICVPSLYSLSKVNVEALAISASLVVGFLPW
jgi:hypothetical protein